MREMRDVFFHSCRAISQLTLGWREVKTVSKSGFKISKKLNIFVSCRGKITWKCNNTTRTEGG